MHVQPGDVFNLKGEIVSRGRTMAKGQRIKTKKIQMGQFGVVYHPPEELERQVKAGDLLPGEVAEVDEAFADTMIVSGRAEETEKPVGLPKPPKGPARRGGVQTQDPEVETQDPAVEK